MNQQNRLLLIMDKLKEETSLSLNDIIAITGASRDTARRDIIRLADENLVTRTYGGISLTNSFNKLDGYLERTDDFVAIKKALAKKAAALAKKGQMTYLDVSTTVALMPQFLPKKELYTITNSIDIADQLLRNTENKTTLLGGILDRDTRSVRGGHPLLELSKYKLNLAFLSCAGIDVNGVYYAYDEDIDIKTLIRQQTEQLVLLCDHTKIGLSHNFLLYDFTQVDYLVTDRQLPEIIAKKIGPEKIIYAMK
ncbi:DeoR/GlpR family DNA-binding transcription regulator [Enterococcus sp. LJL90]